VRLLLIAHAAIVGAGDGDLTAGARARAAALGRVVPRPRAAFCSPARCAGQTAAALGLTATPVAALADRRDEPVEALIARTAAWLAVRAEDHGTVAAITHVAVIRAAVLVALGGAPASFAAIDVAPCSVTELGRRDGRWRLARLNWEPALLHIPQRRGRGRPPIPTTEPEVQDVP
jgi:broad specificity phosphatase PhoE